MGSEGDSNLPQNLQELELHDTCQERLSISDAPAVITINVGGVLFSTHSATLQKVGLGEGPTACCTLTRVSARQDAGSDLQRIQLLPCWGHEALCLSIGRQRELQSTECTCRILAAS